MKNKKQLVMIVMLVAIALMSMGYALFATQLNINSIGNITSTWNVYFESISNGTKVGNASNASTPSVSGTSANMNVNLDLPGDSMTYSLVLKNGGTVGAIIEDIDAKAEGSTGIIYTISGLKIGDKLAAGASKTITVKIEYDPNTTSQPSETYKKLTVTIDAVQDIGQSITSQTPTIEGEYGAFARRIINSNTVQSSTNINFINGPGTVTSYTSVKSSITDMYDFYNNGKSSYYGTNYEFNRSTGKYTISGSTISGKLEDLDDFSKYRYSCRSESVSSSCDILYEITEKLDQYWAMAYTYNGKENYTQDNGKGLYSTIDDNGTTYYFRGEVENNYVQFGTYPEDTSINVYQYDTDATDSYGTLNIKAGTPMYWRIVRVNGDGTIRLIYDGTTLAKNGEEHSAVINVGNYSDGDESNRIGYTYNENGKEYDNLIKSNIDSWYESNLKNSYSSYIADSIFCNDRSIESQTDDDINYVYNRIYTGKPSLTCATSDRYTMNTKNGNGLLKNPIGLLTVDEVMLAGGTTNKSNEKFYLYSGEPFWTMTPYLYSSWEETSFLWAVSYTYTHYADYKLNTMASPWEESGLRPVINLKADVNFTGNGTIDNPYVIKTN